MQNRPAKKYRTYVLLVAGGLTGLLTLPTGTNAGMGMGAHMDPGQTPRSSPATNLSPAPAPYVSPSTSPVPAVNSELRARVQDYLAALLDGARSPLVEVDDYYPVIHFVEETQGATIDSLEKTPDGSYVLKLTLRTRERIEQDPFGKGDDQSHRVPELQEFHSELHFRAQKDFLLFTEKLHAPFVKTGHEKRYLVKSGAR